MEKKDLRLNFTYRDTWEQEYSHIRKYNDAVLLNKSELEFLIDEYKIFLTTLGFSYEQIDKVWRESAIS